MKIMYAAIIWNAGLRTKWGFIGVRLNSGAATSDEMHDQQDKRDEQQNVDRTGRHVKSEKAE